MALLWRLAARLGEHGEQVVPQIHGEWLVRQATEPLVHNVGAPRCSFHGTSAIPLAMVVFYCLMLSASFLRLREVMLWLNSGPT